MTDFDVVIVGSGAAGAAAAWQLTNAGFKVAILDRGVWQDPSEYPTNYHDWEVEKNKGKNPVVAERQNQWDYPVDDSNSPIAICNYNAIGGSTIIYSGHFPRFLPTDFRLKTTENLANDWPFTYEELRPYFEVNEKQMAVSGLSGDPFYPDIEYLLPPVPIGKAGETLAKAFNKLNWHWWPSYSAISTRDKNGRASCLNLGPCNTGCPQGAKSSVDITYVRSAMKKGATVIQNASVSKLLMNGDSVSGVVYYDEKGESKVISGKTVILAASAVGTPRILLNSKNAQFPNGIGNNYDQVGRHLMLHPLGYVEGLFENELDTDVGPQGCMIYSLEHYRAEAKHKLGYMMHALRGTGALETARAAYQRRSLRFGKNLSEDFEKFYRKQLVLSIICEDLPIPSNRVELDEMKYDKNGDPGVKIHYEMHENTKQMMSHGLSNARKLMKEAGAKKSYAYGPVRNTGWHTMGTCRIGHARTDSVVDPQGKCHDVDNLYILDSSVFVTGSCVNPANTIQAVALYLSEKISNIMKES